MILRGSEDIRTWDLRRLLLISKKRLEVFEQNCRSNGPGLTLDLTVVVPDKSTIVRPCNLKLCSRAVYPTDTHDVHKLRNNRAHIPQISHHSASKSGMWHEVMMVIRIDTSTVHVHESVVLHMYVCSAVQ